MNHLERAKECADILDGSTVKGTDTREFLYGITHSLIAIAEQQEERNNIERGKLDRIAMIAEQLVLANAPKKVEMGIEAAIALPTKEPK